MRLLAPGFLLALLALAVPIVLHLVRRERETPQRFPSLYFLRQMPVRAARRHKLRDRLLLASRCLALALLALAFAQPSLGPEVGAAGAARGARERVVVVDRSFSMGHGDRWTRAQAAAREALSDLLPGDRVSLLLFDERVEETPAAEDPATALAALAAASPSARGTRLAPALERAGALLAASSRPRREVVLIGDLQRTGWEDRLRDAPPLPVGTTLRVVGVAEGAAANATVADARLESRSGARAGDAGATVRVSAVLANGGPARPGARIALEVDGRAVEERRVDLPADGRTSVGFEARALPAAGAAVVVRLEPDALPLDDSHAFVVRPPRRLRVLLLEAPDAGPEASLYLERALALAVEPRFELRRAASRRLTDADLEGVALVVLAGARLPAGADAERLRRFVVAGGGLLVGLGEQSLASAAESDAGGLLPGRVGAVVDHTADGGAVVAELDGSHPALAALRGAAGAGLTAARVLRLRAVTPHAEATTVARFDDGAPALVEQRLGAGRVLLWASTLDTFWNDLPLRPAWLPLLHGLARHAVGFVPERATLRVGELLPAGLEPRGGAAVREREQGRFEAAAPGVVEAVDETGARRRVAVVLDPRESDLAALDPEELAATVVARAGDAAPAAGEAGVAAPRSFAFPLLFVALLLLLAEAALGNRLSPRTTGGST